MISETLFLDLLNRVIHLEAKVEILEKQFGKDKIKISDEKIIHDEKVEDQISQIEKDSPPISEKMIKAPTKNEVINVLKRFLPEIRIHKNKRDIGGITLKNDNISLLADLRASKDYSHSNDGFQWSAWHRVSKDDIFNAVYPKDFFIFSVTSNNEEEDNLNFLVFETDTLKKMAEEEDKDKGGYYHFGFQLDDDNHLSNCRYNGKVNDNGELVTSNGNIDLNKHLNNWDIIKERFS